MPPSDAAWQQKLAALRAHVAAHGRLPPHRDATGLGDWVGTQRQAKKAMDLNKTGEVLRGMTPARAAALEGVPGWAWDPHGAIWQEKLAALRAYVATHGQLPPESHPGLGAWVGNQRAAKKAADAGKARHNKMTPERAAALEGVPGWAWEVDLEAAWQERLASLRAFVAAHGRLPPQSHHGLGVWVSSQRAAKKAADAGKALGKRMTPVRAAALEAVPGWAWSADVEALWEEKLAALRAFVAAHGRLPPQSHPSGLGKWVNHQREAKNATAAGKTRAMMTPARAAALEAVPGWAWEVDQEALWQEKLSALRAYQAERGRLPLRSDPSGLGKWVNTQRRAKKAARAGRPVGERMTPQRAAALEAVPGWAWDPHGAIWQEKLAALRAYVAAHGRGPPYGDAAGLSVWVNSQRTAKKAVEAGRSLGERMTMQRVAALESVPGWAWEVDAEAAWEEKLSALRAYLAAHGRLPPQRDASGLGEWVSRQRQARRAADAGRKSSFKMTPARTAALEGVPGWTWGGRRRAAAPAAPPAKRATRAGQ